MCVKSYIILGPGANVIRLFTAVSYDFFNNKLECLLLTSLYTLVHCLWASLVSLHLSGAPERCFTWVGYCLTYKH
jgi:hypothetical protein